MAPDKGEIRTEEVKEICAGATLMATHGYTMNPDSPLGKGDRSTAMGDTRLQGRTRRERTLEASGRQKWTSRIRTSSFPGGNPRRDSRGRGSGATKKGQEDRQEENRIGGWIGQEGEGRKSYSPAVIDGIKRNS